MTAFLKIFFAFYLAFISSCFCGVGKQKLDQYFYDIYGYDNVHLGRLLQNISGFNSDYQTLEKEVDLLISFFDNFEQKAQSVPQIRDVHSSKHPQKYKILQMSAHVVTLRAIYEDKITLDQKALNRLIESIQALEETLITFLTATTLVNIYNSITIEEEKVDLKNVTTALSVSQSLLDLLSIKKH